ncbi:MAG: FAD-dependent oxidoreductase [Pseudomonadota bacterium]
MGTVQSEQDIVVDWLVAGAGAAGMTGAAVAAHLGADVLVVEKEAVFGGTTAKSGGVAWIPGNHRQAQFGVDDSIEEGLTYISGLIGDSVAPARLRAFAERAPEMLEFMMTNSRVEFTPLPSYMDYYEEVEGWKPGGRSMDPGTIDLRTLGDEAANIRYGHYDGLLLPFNITVQEGRRLQEMNLGSYLLGAKLLLRYLLDIPARLKRQRDNRLSLGPALVASLRRTLQDKNVPLWLNAPMQELLVNDGRITGAVVARDGKPVHVHARHGVLLATGGFAHNTGMRQHYHPQPAGSAWTAAAPGSTGDGIIMGEKLGARLAFMGSAWWSPSYTIPDGRVLALIAGKSNPGSIMVNRLGKRFTNEAKPYEDLVKDQYASEANGESAVPCYLIFDANYRGKYPLGHIKPGAVERDSSIPAGYFSSGLLTRADSVNELGESLGMDGATLEQTIALFNEHAAKGEDPVFGRGESLHDRYYADPKVEPNPSLAPIAKPPFYAFRCDPGDLDTKGGLDCDEYARVLDSSGKVITGLYAAGNTSAAVMGDTYPGAGATIASAMTFGYIAARHALAEAAKESPHD